VDVDVDLDLDVDVDQAGGDKHRRIGVWQVTLPAFSVHDYDHVQVHVQVQVDRSGSFATETNDGDRNCRYTTVAVTQPSTADIHG
jgi:hypothetical protein